MNIRWENSRLVHGDYDDVYFNPLDGLGESNHVFIEGNRLRQRFAALRPGEVFVIGEAGFGVGRNFIATWICFQAHAPAKARLQYHAFELCPPPFEVAAQALAPFAPMAERLPLLRESWPLSIPGCAPVWVGDPAIELRVWVGDIAERLPETGFTADAWFLDGFSPAKNPVMWSSDVLHAIARRSRSSTTLATYSAAGWVRRGLEAVGFAPRRQPGFRGKRHMVVASCITPPTSLPSPPAPRYPSPAHHEPGRIAVVGGGIAGASVARHLAEDGHLVTVFEQHTPASGASGNPLGLVQPLPNRKGSPIGDWYSRAFVWTRFVAAQHGLPWDACGVHRHPTSEKKARYAQQIVTELGWHGVLSATDDGVLHIQHAAIIDPREWCHRLLQHPGIDLRANTAVSTLADGRPWRVHGTRFDTVILANSADAAMLTQGLPLRWVRGQLGWVSETAVSALQQPALCHDGYLLPSRDGCHIVGATYTPDDTDLTWREEDWQDLIQRLQHHLPEHHKTLGAPLKPTGGRVALRGVTPGRLPFVGPGIVPEAIAQAWHVHGGDRRPLFGREGLQEGLWCSVGHGSRGLSSGPLAGAVLAAQIQGQPPPVSTALTEATHPARACLRAIRHRMPLSSLSKTP